MRHALWLKFIAVALCAAALLVAVGGGLGLFVLAHEDLLGEQTYEEAVAETTDLMLPRQAEQLASNWASVEYGGMPEDAAEILRDVTLWNWLDEDGYAYTILDEKRKPLYSSGNIADAEQELEYTFQNLEYEEFLALGYDEALLKEGGVFHYRYYGDDTHGGVSYTAREKTLETSITVKLSLAPGAIQPSQLEAFLGEMSRCIGILFAALIGGLLVFAACAVYLCAAAGCKKGTSEIKAGGLNALPLDLYAGGVLLLLVLCVEILDELGPGLEHQSIPNLLWLGSLLGFVCCLAFVVFCFAFAAQVKMKGGHWLWNSVAGR